MTTPASSIWDVIGGFPYASPTCKGCGNPLSIENAWMADGCPCNAQLGVNSMNETRWRLLMQLQQQQSRELEQLKAKPAGRVIDVSAGDAAKATGK